MSPLPTLPPSPIYAGHMEVYCTWDHEYFMSKWCVV